MWDFCFSFATRQVFRLCVALLISRRSSHTTHLTPLMSHHSSHTDHSCLTPLTSHLLSHQNTALPPLIYHSSHIIHHTQTAIILSLNSPHSSQRHFLSTTHFNRMSFITHRPVKIQTEFYLRVAPLAIVHAMGRVSLEKNKIHSPKSPRFHCSQVGSFHSTPRNKGDLSVLRCRLQVSMLVFVACTCPP